MWGVFLGAQMERIKHWFVVISSLHGPEFGQGKSSEYIIYSYLIYVTLNKVPFILLYWQELDQQWVCYINHLGLSYYIINSSLSY